MQHIIAIGGLLPEASNAVLLDYALRLADVPRPRLGYLATASGDSQFYLNRFDQLAAELSCQPSILPLFHRTPDVREWIGSQDVILVGGGNTKSMLAIWREWDLPQLLRQAWQSGTVLAGWSAGAICWFEQGMTDSWAGRLDMLPCLGFIAGSCCPHYSAEADRRPAYHQLLHSGRIAAGYAVDDGAGVHFAGEAPRAVVAVVENATARRVAVHGSGIQETPLDVEHILL
jgi:dipeptidase E